VKTALKLMLYALAIFVFSYVLMSTVHLSGPVGERIAGLVTEYRNGLPMDLSSEYAIIVQALALTLFFTVIVATIMNMEWRVAAVIAGIGILVVSGIVPPQDLISKAVDWRLLIFLIGSMTFAGILKGTGVFNKLAISLVNRSRSATTLLLLLGLFSAILSMTLGEVTSIIYSMLIIFELRRVLRINLKPLIIFTVLATNTGSVALPIGNPIGIYLAFTANIMVSEFLVKCLTLSLIELLILVSSYRLLLRKYIDELNSALIESRGLISKLVTARTTDVTHLEVRHYRLGIFMFTLFILLVVSSEYLALLITQITGTPVDAHSLLAFLPYFTIALMLASTDPSQISKLMETSVEWPSLFFFIGLFILSYSLNYTGAIAKMTYIIASLTEPGTFWGNIVTTGILLVSSAALSAVLDNLSVIVAFTQPAIMLVKLGLTRNVYLALLYGGVFGGNYTPIGSTANIVAISMAEREKMKISWGDWLRIAAITTTIQITVAIIWNYLWILIGG